MRPLCNPRGVRSVKAMLPLLACNLRDKLLYDSLTRSWFTGPLEANKMQQ
jgi:hypothetical protein